MASKNKLTVQHYSRPGEGALIATVRPKIGPSGEANSEHLSIDLASAPVPDRRYAAEVGAVVQSQDMLRILFGQTKAIGKGLSSLLIIHVSFRAARAFLHSASGVVKNASDHLAKYNVEKASLLELEGQTEPTQTATVEANVIAAAFAGREACIDFYHASSFALHGFGITGKFYADPTVRVTLAVPLFIAIYEWLLSHKNELPADEVEDLL